MLGSLRRSPRLAAARPPLASMPLDHQTPAIEDRAVEVQTLLADQGRHRAPSVPDLILAATAELTARVVRHVDEDFELAEITGQASERVVTN